MKKEHFLQSEGFKTVAASVLSILIGLAVGSIVILIVGLTSPNLSLSSAWDGIRIVFGGLFSTGRDASGTLTWGFNPTNIGNMLFRAAPLIMTGLSVGMAYKTGLFNIGAPGQYLIGTLVSLSIALGLPSETMSTTLIWLLAFLGGTLAGAIWGAIPGLFKALLNINEVLACITALQLPERLLVMVNASTSPLSPKADSQSAMFGQALKVRPFVPRSVVTIASTLSAASSRNSSTAVRTVSGTLTKSTPSMVSRSQLESAAMRI